MQRDDLKAYHYFNQLVEDYDEDQPDRRNLSAISNAFVAVGVYCLNGIPNSDVRPDPRRAHELFQYAATIFGDPNAQYNLAHMYMVGAGASPRTISPPFAGSRSRPKRATRHRRLCSAICCSSATACPISARAG